MIDELPAAYDVTPLAPDGGVVGTVSEDGEVSLHWEPAKDREPKFNKWKGGEKIMQSGDDKVKLIGRFTRGDYYSVCGSTVVYRGKGWGKKKQYLCLKPGHICNSCPHTKRLDRYRMEHPVEVAA